MIFRLATKQDLFQIKNMYLNIVNKMTENNIFIWDSTYPCEFLENDIDNHALYILLKGSEILAAFSWYNSNLGAKSIQWSTNSNKVFYLDRLGVNISYSRAGIGSLMLLKAQETARNMGAEYLRLFVVTNNTPAICLYSKNGFTRAKGIYHEIIDSQCTFLEYGYEIKL